MNRNLLSFEFPENLFNVSKNYLRMLYNFVKKNDDINELFEKINLDFEKLPYQGLRLFDLKLDEENNDEIT